MAKQPMNAVVGVRGAIMIAVGDRRWINKEYRRYCFLDGVLDVVARGTGKCPITNNLSA